MPKKRDSKNDDLFRTISLLNVEGKYPLLFLPEDLTIFLMANKYINTSVQKGGVPGF